MVNSGRLSVPSTYHDSPLNTPDEDVFTGGVAPGAPAVDAPGWADGEQRWLLETLGGAFVVLDFGGDPLSSQLSPDDKAATGVSVSRVLVVGSGVDGSTAIQDREGLIAQRYDGQRGTVYLMRPDGHVAARWRSYDATKIRLALNRALGKSGANA